jgi:hypothetical protein
MKEHFVTIKFAKSHYMMFKNPQAGMLGIKKMLRAIWFDKTFLKCDLVLFNKIQRIFTVFDLAITFSRFILRK